MDKLEAFAEGDGAHIKGIKWQFIIDHTNRNYLKSMGTNVAYNKFYGNAMKCLRLIICDVVGQLSGESELAY